MVKEIAFMYRSNSIEIVISYALNKTNSSKHFSKEMKRMVDVSFWLKG